MKIKKITIILIIICIFLIDCIFSKRKMIVNYIIFEKLNIYFIVSIVIDTSVDEY